MTQAMNKDRKRFAAANKTLGIVSLAPEPVNEAYSLYELKVTLQGVLDELELDDVANLDALLELTKGRSERENLVFISALKVGTQDRRAFEKFVSDIRLKNK